MKPDLYEHFVALKNAGKKAEAKAALVAFLSSLGTLKQKNDWAFPFLEAGNYGHKIRHEIYETVIYPVLLDGYLKNDARSIFWLAKTATNLQEVRAPHRSLRNKSDFTFFKEAHALKPSIETQIELLDVLVKQFAYAQHEWPAGILYGNDAANLEQCEVFLREVEFARSIDQENTLSNYLGDFEAKVRLQMKRLQ